MSSGRSTYTRTPDQLRQDEQKRLARLQRRGNGSASATDRSGKDYIDGFEQSIGLFGDSSVANGEAGQIFDYDHGLLKLHLANVDGGSVKLMSHFVWNAALVMAEYIEKGDVIDVHGKRVIEFGAGAALPGLLCVKRGAAFVTVTDYPDPAIVRNLERNWYENLIESEEDKEARRISGQESVQTTSFLNVFEGTSEAYESATTKRQVAEQKARCAVRGHAWGQSVDDMLDCLSTSVSPATMLSGSRPKYDWILMADTLWVSEGHPDLLKSCLAVLDKSGKVLICCGLHTGYNTVQRFLALAESDRYGFVSRLIEIRRVPLWGDSRTPDELREESSKLREEDLEQFTTEDRNRTVLVYELSLREEDCIKS
ncbi:EEF1A N-terminal glycine/lysine methyltransferase [Entomortierella parvispora]|uniref:EEF1A N-terminal glycine/lysine methyltransferase n=1 Tax=Entomortierella parvispora TaxID=205924 RepID=A0A9P3HAM0_9FUNG|nr:EEF1A N-terminal glycine/lysine methyltransferase [Entomortierella parvispora]